MEQESISFKVSRRICILGSLLILLYACLLSWKSIAGFPTVEATHQHWPWLANKPFGEDGFYLLTVSNTLATTHHLAYNYGRTATGIQPLITFIFAAVAWVVHLFHGDRWMLVRVLIVFNSSLFVLFAWQMASIAERFAPVARKNLVFVFAFFLAIFNFSLFRLFNYGLETGVYLLLISCAYCMTLRMTRPGEVAWSDVVGLGVTSGFAGLARIDFGVLLAIVLGVLLVRRRMTLAQVTVCGLIALIIVSPWFLFVHATIGSWMPSSGQTEGGLISASHLDRIPAMGASILSNLAPWTFSFTAPYSLGLVFACVSLCFLMFLFYRSPETRAWLTEQGGYLSHSGPWVLAIVILVLVYVLGFGVVGFYTRYTTPLLLLTVPLAALIFSEQRVFSQRPWLVPATLGLVFFAYDVTSLHRGNTGSDWILTAGYIHEHYPEAHVGAFQSGTIGYFDSNVDNLDGKLNIDALRATKANRMAEYIDQQGYTELVDWSSYFDGLPADYLKREWTACPYPMYSPAATCLTRKTAP